MCQCGNGLACTENEMNTRICEDWLTQFIDLHTQEQVNLFPL